MGFGVWHVRLDPTTEKRNIMVLRSYFVTENREGLNLNLTYELLFFWFRRHQICLL